MKKLYLFTLAATMALFSACSSSEDVVEEAPQVSTEETVSPFGADGVGYISMSVNLPTVPSSRANDEFDDGEADEYAVKDVNIIFFTGSDEANATYLTSYETSTPPDGVVEDADKDNITSSFNFAAQVSGTIGTNLYALVLLNTKEITLPSPISTTKIADYASTLANATNLVPTNKTTNGIFMANAPITSTPGGTSTPTAKITTLVQLDKSKIFNTEAEAKMKPAGEVFVERGVAKVSLRANASIIPSDPSDVETWSKFGAGNITYKIEDWKLDNTNSTSYIVRNVAASPTWLAWKTFSSPDNYRMVGYTKIGETSIQPKRDLYRVYWAEDVNYTGIATLNTITENTWTTGLDLGAYAYCNENTFNLESMLYKNTTRVIIKAILNGGTTFYTLNGATDEITTQSASEGYIQGQLLINSSLKAWADNSTYGLISTKTLESTDFDYTYDNTTTPGIYALKTFTLKDASKTKFVDGDAAATALTSIASDIISTVNASCVIREYTNGETYYDVRIRHFDDTETPWNNGESAAGVTVPTATTPYPTGSDSYYTGRYGVLRNNWYDIDVTSILKIGLPTIPTITGTRGDLPDDNLDSYIACKINVLSWAKRTQSVTLQ